MDSLVFLEEVNPFPGLHGLTLIFVKLGLNSCENLASAMQFFHMLSPAALQL